MFAVPRVSAHRERPAAPPDQERAMAKGQKKSNKEVRKPKAEKAKPAVPVGRDFTSPPGKGK